MVKYGGLRTAGGAFRVMMLGDLQPTNTREVTSLREVVADDLVGADGNFTIAMGDTLSLYPRVQNIMGRIGMSVYYVPGNHDVNRDSDGRSTSTIPSRGASAPDVIYLTRARSSSLC